MIPHALTYAADGATITATCATNVCTLTNNQVTLTIVALTLKTYGGTGDAKANLTGLSDFNRATGKTIAATEIRYVGRDGTSYVESAAAPSNAGKYTAKITVSGVKTSEGDNKSVSASVDYAIDQTMPTITTNPRTSEITYGQTLANSTLTGGAASVAGSFGWKDPATAPAVADSQKTEYDVVFTPTDGKYAKVECKVKLTVNKAANPARVSSTAIVKQGGKTTDLADSVKSMMRRGRSAMRSAVMRRVVA